MDKLKSEILVSELLSRLQAGYVINEEYYRRLFRMLGETLECTDKMDESFEELKHEVYHAYRIEQVSHLAGFDYGALWAVMCLIDKCGGFEKN